MSVGDGRIYHANVNCSNLESSLAFYRDLLGLGQWSHTAPGTDQDGEAFGLPRARWDAFILGTPGAPRGAPPVVDLLEWKVPRPVGRPYASANQLGFASLVLSRADLTTQREALTRSDARGITAEGDLDGRGGTAFSCLDPDGTRLVLVSGDADRFAGLVVSCSDLERSLPFYVDVLGLEVSDPPAPGAASGNGVHGMTEGAARIECTLTDGQGFAVRLVQWQQPPAEGTPYSQAHHLGIFRVAMLTGDIGADYAALRASGVRCWSPPMALDMGPGIPDLRAILFADPDGATWELIEPGATSSGT